MQLWLSPYRWCWKTNSGPLQVCTLTYWTMNLSPCLVFVVAAVVSFCHGCLPHWQFDPWPQACWSSALWLHLQPFLFWKGKGKSCPLVLCQCARSAFSTKISCQSHCVMSLARTVFPSSTFNILPTLNIMTYNTCEYDELVIMFLSAINLKSHHE